LVCLCLKSKATPDSKRFNITERYDAVFWSGDLNYRINGLRNMVCGFSKITTSFYQEISIMFLQK